MTRSLLTALLITLIWPFAAAVARAAELVEEASLLSGVPAGLGMLGTSVDIDGDVAVVGAFQEGPLSDAGAAYVYERGPLGWQVVARLTASNAATDDEFAKSVAISGDIIVAGAPVADVPGVFNAGAAYVFVRPAGGWQDMTETAILSASGADLSHSLGNAVDIDGDTIIVGDMSDQWAGFTSGAGYVYVRPAGGWVDATESARLQSSGGVWYDRVAEAVTISGTTIALGGIGISTQTVQNPGGALIFERPAGGWAGTQTETQALFAGTPVQTDYFGISVALSGDTLLVGAHLDDAHDPQYALCDSGAAYVFTRGAGTWTQQAKLVSSQPDCLRYFGRAVALDGDRAVVGSPGANQGVAIVFDRTGSTWTEGERLTSVYRDGFDHYAEAVAVDGDRLVVGAARNINQGVHSPGAAFVFAPGVDWTDLGHALPGIHGAPTLKGEGTFGPNSTTVARLENARENSMSIWVIGASAILAPLFGGTLVPHPDIVVFVETGPAGAVTAAASWPAGVPSGAGLWLQTWVVDAAAPQGVSATNALSVVSP